MAAEASRRRANPSARMSALYSVFGTAEEESAAAPVSPAEDEPVAGEDESISVAARAAQQPGLTAREHKAKARAAVVATWQIPAAPLFWQASRSDAKACAAVLAEQLTMARIDREVAALRA